MSLSKPSLSSGLEPAGSKRSELPPLSAADFHSANFLSNVLGLPPSSFSCHERSSDPAQMLRTLQVFLRVTNLAKFSFESEETILSKIRVEISNIQRWVVPWIVCVAQIGIAAMSLLRTSQIFRYPDHTSRVGLPASKAIWWGLRQ